MKSFTRPLIAIGLLLGSTSGGGHAAETKLKVFIARNRSEGPASMAAGGLNGLLARWGCEVGGEAIVRLTPEEEKEYGDWNRAAIENKHLGRLVAANGPGADLIIGLLTNCTDLLGMLAGLQHLGPVAMASRSDPRGLRRDGLAGLKPLRLGLVWIDAHADFNTPETSLSGMLGGMPVAIASGLCLTRLRLKTELDPALPTKYIVMAGIRDVDPLEQELLDRSDVEMISTEDIRNLTENLRSQMKRLSGLTDLIYIHIDMDVLEPSEVSGHPLTVPEGPTSRELAAALELMFRYEKSAAIGIASLPFGEKDKDGVSLQSAYRLLEGAVKGVRSRAAGAPTGR